MSRVSAQGAVNVAFFNQASGPLFRELVAAAAPALGPVSYYSTDQDLNAAPGVTPHNAPSYNRNSGLTRLVSWAAFMFWGAWHGLREEGRPFMFIVTNPPFAPLIGYLAKKLQQRKYGLLFYDMYPEAMEGLGYVSKKSLVSRVWRWLNRLSVRNADLVVTISPGLANTVSQYMPRGGRIELIPTWVDTDRILPIPKVDNPFAREHGQVDKLTVMYAGNIGAVHDISMLPRLAERLRLVPQVEFLIIGEGAGKRRLEDECKALQLTNVRFLPYQPEDVLPYSLPTADVAVVSLARGGEGVSMPSKTYYSMAAGSAVLGISQPGSDLDQVISKHVCGVSVAHGDLDSAEQVIRQYLEVPQLLKQHCENARRAAEAHYSARVCIAQLLKRIEPFVG
jgi:glycosyltransferase involved in cell wall biosynthesis